MEIKPEIWASLTNDEKISLNLSLGMKKSTWESGEIMNKSHYKYIEIKSRAERLFKLFYGFLEKYRKLVPAEANITPIFREYLEYLIIQRKQLKEAISLIGDYSFKNRTIREALIIQELNHLRTSKREVDRDLYELILEFDRWNSFRLLPFKVQEPSAYKRRNKIRNLKHLKNLCNLPKVSLDVIKGKYSYGGKSVLYVPIISRYFEYGYEILTIENNNWVIQEISRIGLFIFEDRDDAEKFSILIKEYIYKKSKKPGDGQRFWPMFRVFITRASNYFDIEKIDPSRKNLENAFFDLEIKYQKKERRNRKVNDDIGSVIFD